MLNISHYFIRFNPKSESWEIVDQYEQTIVAAYSTEEEAEHNLEVVNTHGKLPENDPLES